MAKNVKTNLSEEMQAAVDNYGSQIQTLEDFVSAVRKLPGMYIGPIGNKGFLNMIREIFQNSVDQLIDDTSPCNHIELYYDMNTLLVKVGDNGKGFPFGDMVRILTKQHTSKNYNKEEGSATFSSGTNGATVV